MQKNPSEIGATKLEILKLLADEKNAQLSLKRIGQIVGVEKPTVKEHIDDLVDQNLVTIDKSPKIVNIKKLTREGFRTATCGTKPNALIKDQYDHGEIRVHRFIPEFEIKNPEELDEGWVERHLTTEPVRFQYNGQNKSYNVFAESYSFRITNEKVFVQIHEVRGLDPNSVKNAGFARAFRARDWLENNSPVRLKSKPTDLSVYLNEQHIAIVKDPFALMIKNSPLDLGEVKIHDKESGELRIKFDESVGVPELESESLRWGEQDIEKIRKHYEKLIHDGVEQFHDLPDKVESLSRRLEELEGRPKRTALAEELEFTSKWTDGHGNLMGWSPELEKPVKIIPKEEFGD